MNKVKWTFVITGMSTLLAGLIIQTRALLIHEPRLLQDASWAYIVGAILLIAPPVIEFKMAQNEGDRKFAQLLIVLEFFLVGSGLLFFWDGNLPAKIAVRLGASFGVTAFLKYRICQLPDFKWSFFLNPVEFVRYNIDCLRGRYGPAYPLSLGIDWLGVGYAFLGSMFGKVALLIGSLFLFVAALSGYKHTKASIPLAWSVLNGLYVGFGVVFIALALR
jgi:hypothetical protein